MTTDHPFTPPQKGGSYVVDPKTGKPKLVDRTANPGDPDYRPQPIVSSRQPAAKPEPKAPEPKTPEPKAKE